jgi:hypothetical protein
MADIDFEAINPEGNFDWPKRGRTKLPLPEKLVDSLHKSFTNGSTPNIVLHESAVTKFANLLSKAGRELNYRIEREIRPHPDNPSYKIYYYRVKSRRKQEEV